MSTYPNVGRYEIKHPTLEEVKEYFKGSFILRDGDNEFFGPDYEIIEDPHIHGRFLFKAVARNVRPLNMAYQNGQYATILEREQPAKPTLNDVIEHFKGVKTIKSKHHGWAVDVSGQQITEQSPGHFVFVPDKDIVYYHAYSDGSYAEILEREQSLEDQVNEYDTKKTYADVRYPMCDDQPAQIDCRVTDCASHKDGKCINVSPAITIGVNGSGVCWSYFERGHEFETGQAVWFRVNKALVWHFGIYYDVMTVLNQFDPKPLKVTEIRPFFVNGQATHPPFND